MQTIIEIDDLSLQRRLFHPLLLNFIISLINAIMILILSKNIILGVFSLIILFIILLVLTYSEISKYYIYKIQHDGESITFDYFIWNKKAKLSACLKDIKIDYIKDTIPRSVIYKIIFNKKHKIFLEIKPKVSFSKSYWDEYNILDLYEKLVEIQKQARSYDKK